jgi:hypothetical protein
MSTENNREYLFAGVWCSIATYERWNEKRVQGICPWCAKRCSGKYGGMRRHLRACPDRPKTLVEAFAP